MSVRTAANACSRVGWGTTAAGAARTCSDRVGWSAGDGLGQGLTMASIAVSPFDRHCGRGCHRGGRISHTRFGRIRPMHDDRTPHSHFTWLRSEGSLPRKACPLARKPSCSRRRAAPYILLRGKRAIAQLRRQPSSKLMLNEVYNSRILDLAGNIPRLGRLDNPDATATAHSKLCGSTVTVDLKMDGDTVTDFSHQVKACALGQASSSIMARNVVGAKADELRSLRETVRRMLKENGAPPSGKWSDIAVLEPVRDYKARHASTMLTFDAVTAAIDQIEAKRRAAMAAE